MRWTRQRRRDRGRRASESSGDLVLALAFLARTRADSAPQAGRAFLALARSDSAGAARQFNEASAVPALSDAAPLLLSTSARLLASRRDDPSARAIWMLVDPTPPAAAVTSTVSPRRMRATSASAWKAVNATSG